MSGSWRAGVGQLLMEKAFPGEQQACWVVGSRVPERQWNAAGFLISGGELASLACASIFLA
ncbi:MAG: hypothetical protein JSV77_03610 [Dehalococcoidales bacterium]|nr:MAG: hypothetical protein JSV77_03610 [Dehalococcoidales bacterium]